MTDKEIISVIQDLHGHLTTRFLKPNYMRLDNEASPAFQALPKKKCIDYQLSPTVMHRRNTAESATSTLKDDFIAVLCVTDLDFPM